MEMWEDMEAQTREQFEAYNVKQRSTGHLCIIDGYEYFKGEKYVFKGDLRDPVECTGTRNGRFYCTLAAWENMPAYRQAVKEALERRLSETDQAERSAMV